MQRSEILAKRRRPRNKPHLMANLPEVRDRYLEIAPNPKQIECPVKSVGADAKS
jgi:hypothetical protein